VRCEGSPCPLIEDRSRETILNDNKDVGISGREVDGFGADIIAVFQRHFNRGAIIELKGQPLAGTKAGSRDNAGDAFAQAVPELIVPVPDLPTRTADRDAREYCQPVTIESKLPVVHHEDD
jgi:hypothetical protein